MKEIVWWIAWQQALRGALAAEREQRWEVATTSLEFEYLLRKIGCEMLIGGDDISNDVITRGTCFPMFVYIRARFRFALVGGNLAVQLTGSLGELEVEFKFQRRSCKFSCLFPPRLQSASESLLAGCVVEYKRYILFGHDHSLSDKS